MNGPILRCRCCGEGFRPTNGHSPEAMLGLHFEHNSWCRTWYESDRNKKALVEQALEAMRRICS